MCLYAWRCLVEERKKLYINLKRKEKDEKQLWYHKSHCTMLSILFDEAIVTRRQYSELCCNAVKFPLWYQKMHFNFIPDINLSFFSFPDLHGRMHYFIIKQSCGKSWKTKLSFCRFVQIYCMHHCFRIPVSTLFEIVSEASDLTNKVSK